MSLKTQIQHTLSGIAALQDWLGDNGEPVHQMVAELRSNPCLEGNNGEPCPMNKAPKWWERAKEKAAEWIRKELELKNNMRLEVDRKSVV